MPASSLPGARRPGRSCDAGARSQPRPVHAGETRSRGRNTPPRGPQGAAGRTRSVGAPGILEGSKPEHTVQEKLAAQLVFSSWRSFQATKRWKVALQSGVGETPRTAAGKKAACTNPVYVSSPPLATTPTHSQDTVAA